MIKSKQYYSINKKKQFKAINFLKHVYLEEAFKFAWDMTFGGVGHNRCYRSGGESRRKNGEMFLNIFQGKLAEFAIYQVLTDRGIIVDYPNLQRYGVGEWNAIDYEIEGRLLSIKSTRHYGNLLLLEEKDWDDKGRYKPNKGISHEKYDYFILVRLKLQLEASMRDNRLYYASECNKEKLRELIYMEKIEFDIPGFIDYDEFLEAINTKKIIYKGDRLNNTTTMDADNYYFEAGEIRDIEVLYDYMELISELLWDQRANTILDYIEGYY